MATPYDGKILLVSWLGRTTPGATIAGLAALIRARTPNVAGVMLKTSNGVSWQGHLNDSGPLAITGVTRIAEWVAEFERQGLEVHVWGVPRAKRPPGAEKSPDLAREAEKFANAASVPGVRSLLLDVELGPAYWQGRPPEVTELMATIRGNVPAGTHIGLILDGRRNRPFSFWVDPWIPFVDSLHPMVYPVLFGSFQSIEQHLDEAFRNLAGYNKPIAPMLQAFGEFNRRPTPDEITRQGTAAWRRGAAGLSFFRLGSDLWIVDKKPQMGDPEYAAIAQIPLPGQPGQVAPPTYTWQNVINATVTVAARANGDWVQWFGDAGVWRVFDNALRDRPYTGPAIEFWPLPLELRRQILELVGLSPAELARLTAAAQAEEGSTP